jgi:hypothetical protein
MIQPKFDYACGLHQLPKSNGMKIKTSEEINFPYLGEKRRSIDVFIAESNRNFVFAWRGWQIVNRNGSIFVVFIVDLEIQLMSENFVEMTRNQKLLQLCLGLRWPSTIHQLQLLS